MITFLKKIYGNIFFRLLGCINEYDFTPPQNWMLWLLISTRRQLHLCGCYRKKDKCLQWHLPFRGIWGSDSAHCHKARPGPWAPGAVLCWCHNALGQSSDKHPLSACAECTVLSSVLALTDTGKFPFYATALNVFSMKLMHVQFCIGNWKKWQPGSCCSQFANYG